MFKTQTCCILQNMLSHTDATSPLLRKKGNYLVAWMPNKKCMASSHYLDQTNIYIYGESVFHYDYRVTLKFQALTQFTVFVQIIHALCRTTSCSEVSEDYFLAFHDTKFNRIVLFFVHTIKIPPLLCSCNPSLMWDKKQNSRNIISSSFAYKL